MPRETFCLRPRIAGFGLAAFTILLAGCNIGPQYARPSVPVPPAYKEAGAPNVTGDGKPGEWQPAHPSDVASRGKWWEVYQDPQLNALEEKLNIENQNIAAAAAAVQVARSLIREARAQYTPTVTANPGISNNRISTGLGRQIGVTYASFSLPFEATWEPDLWGRIRNTVKSNAAAAQASAADLENVRLAAQSDLAADYYELRAQDELKRIFGATITAYQEALELNRNLLASGVGADEAVAQAEAQLEAIQAQATNLEVLRAQYEHAIGLLTGQPASLFTLGADKFKPNPPAIPLNLPAQLLERRPDIATAERLVAQANAQIGLAKTAYYPAITLGATVGLQAISIANWLTWPARVWSAGPALAETLFDGGLRRATMQQFQASYDETAAKYRQTVLTAFQQVEDNLSTLRILTQVIAQQDSAIESARRSLQEAEVRYQAGLDPYLNVIAAQTLLLNDQQAAVNFREQRMVASVQLIKALGGGWDASQLPTEKVLAAKPTNGTAAR